MRSWCLPSTVCSRYVCRTGGAWGQGLLPPIQVQLMVTACSPAGSRCPPPCSAGTEGAVTSSLSLHPHLGKVPDELPLVVGQHVLNFLLAEGPGAQQPCFLQPQTPPTAHAWLSSTPEGLSPPPPLIIPVTHRLRRLPRGAGQAAAPLAFDGGVVAVRPLDALQDGPDDAAGHGGRAEQLPALAALGGMLLGGGRNPTLMPWDLDTPRGSHDPPRVPLWGCTHRLCLLLPHQRCGQQARHAWRHLGFTLEMRWAEMGEEV